MNGVFLGEGDRTALVGRLADNVEDTAEDALAHGDGNGSGGVEHFRAALETFGAAHGDGADPAFTEVLLDFERQFDSLAADFEIDFERVIDFGQRSVCRVEFNVHDGTDDLDDFSFGAHDVVMNGLADRELRGGDFEKFGGDGGLAGLVVFEGQVLHEGLGVVGGALHGDHAGAVFRSAGAENHLVKLMSARSTARWHRGCSGRRARKGCRPRDQARCFVLRWSARPLPGSVMGAKERRQAFGRAC